MVLLPSLFLSPLIVSASHIDSLTHSLVLPLAQWFSLSLLLPLTRCPFVPDFRSLPLRHSLSLSQSHHTLSRYYHTPSLVLPLSQDGSLSRPPSLTILRSLPLTRCPSLTHSPSLSLVVSLSHSWSLSLTLAVSHRSPPQFSYPHSPCPHSLSLADLFSPSHNGSPSLTQ